MRGRPLDRSAPELNRQDRGLPRSADALGSPWMLRCEAWTSALAARRSQASASTRSQRRDRDARVGRFRARRLRIRTRPPRGRSGGLASQHLALVLGPPGGCLVSTSRYASCRPQAGSDGTPRAFVALGIEIGSPMRPTTLLHVGARRGARGAPGASSADRHRLSAARRAFLEPA